MSRSLRHFALPLAVAVAALPARVQAQEVSVGSLLMRAISAADSALTTSLRGRSGKLKLRIFGPNRELAIPVVQRYFGDSAVLSPGIHRPKVVSPAVAEVAVATVIPFEEKSGRTLNGYRVGYWPAERGRLRGSAYVNPDGFIEVTQENRDTPVSEHFRLGDFLTHDQSQTWPKYLVLRDELIDKLELIIDDLNANGVKVTRVKVLSGFRHPEYNTGLRKRSRRGPGSPAQDSRHQFGDAADIIIDNNGDGRMDDLNGDGRVNSVDIRLLLQAVERVEKAHPELVGGAGLYRATSRTNPFIHVDVRGTRSRWGRA
jgi:hypothetical protein